MKNADLAQSIEELRCLKEGWDGELACAPSSSGIDQAKRFAERCGELASVLEAGLHADGAVLLEIGSGAAGSFRFSGDGSVVVAIAGCAPFKSDLPPP